MAARATTAETAVSPEFILRPSLSAPAPTERPTTATAGVAGVYTPAFVERSTALLKPG